MGRPRKLRVEISGAFSFVRAQKNGKKSATFLFLSAAKAAVEPGSPSPHQAYMVFDPEDVELVAPPDPGRWLGTAVQYGGRPVLMVPLDGREVAICPDLSGGVAFGTMSGVVKVGQIVPRGLSAKVDPCFLTGPIKKKGALSARLVVKAGRLKSREAFQDEEHDVPWLFGRRLGGEFRCLYDDQYFTDRMLLSLDITTPTPTVRLSGAFRNRNSGMTLFLKRDKDIDASICCLPGFSGFDSAGEATIRHFPAVYDILNDRKKIPRNDRAYPKKPQMAPFTHDLVNDCFACNEVEI